MVEPLPDPPRAVPDELVDALDDLSAARLEAVSAYAAQLAAHRAQSERTETERDERETRPVTGDRPDDVPAKATLTVKNINNNRYYYWQWREEEKVKSKYKGPAGEES
jgi:hypothetical protein